MILLTGASGFIGGHLLTALISEYGENNILAFTSNPLSNCKYLLHNEYRFSSDYFLKHGYADVIDTLIIAGAFTPKNSLQANAWKGSNSNIINLDVLLGANLPKLKKIIYLSTLDVYNENNIISEESQISPVSLYGHSKFYGENLIKVWASSRDIICQILRIGHVYGPGEDAYQKIIPVTIRKIMADEEIQIFGTGNELRSFIYISDVVTAILNSLSLEFDIGPVNLVGGQAVTIRELVNKIIIISKKDTKVKIVNPDHSGRDFVFNNSKMKKYLLSSEVSLEDGLLEEWRYMGNL